ncbi:MAG: YihY/virulence factor BrkB family protein [Isosphaeraceae bacterium]|nr:YihY/virulence factor BrkB family protein [Isosphaeraceae bacterium]
MSKFPPVRLREAFSLGGLSLRELAIRTWRKANENEVMTRAAAVSFYAMLALVPLLGLVVTLAAQLLPDLTDRTGRTRGVGDLTVAELESTLRAIFPRDAYSVIESQIVRLQQQPPFGLISLGLVVTLWLASSLYVAVMDAMNRIYGVHETRSWLKIRLMAIGMTVSQAVILIGSLVLIITWPHVISGMGLGRPAALLATLIQYLGVTFIVLMSFALTFYVGPDAEQQWEWITPGSVIGAIIFLAVSLLFRVYVQNVAHYDRTYGSLGGVMVLLFWFWISSLVLLVAGQINKIVEDASPLGKSYGQRRDPGVAPDFEGMKPERPNEANAG